MLSLRGCRALPHRVRGACKKAQGSRGSNWCLHFHNGAAEQSMHLFMSGKLLSMLEENADRCVSHVLTGEGQGPRMCFRACLRGCVHLHMYLQTLMCESHMNTDRPWSACSQYLRAGLRDPPEVGGHTHTCTHTCTCIPMQAHIRTCIYTQVHTQTRTLSPHNAT